MGLNYKLILQKAAFCLPEGVTMAIPCPLVVCLICTHSALGPAALGCTYQANHSCPWYNYNIYIYIYIYIYTVYIYAYTVSFHR